MTDQYFPPEWAPQSAVLIAWPHPDGDFAPWYTEVNATYLRIAEAVSKRETLVIACANEPLRRHVMAQLEGSAADVQRILALTIGYDDIWVRDTAPLTIETRTGPRLLDFRFNGWGSKYECSRDRAFARNLMASQPFDEVPGEAVDFVLEGGSIDTDGEGTLLTTRYCLLNPNRNPTYTASEIEAVLRKRLGVHRILWLDYGRAEGDDTDAHVDTLARFCSPEMIAYTSCDDPDDPHYEGLKAMEEELRSLRSVSGAPYRLVALPIPQPIVDEHGKRLPATYANFLVINGAVLLPVYADPHDETAARRLQECFPDRQIVPIDCRPLICQYGSLHCMTMQFPAALPFRKAL